MWDLKFGRCTHVFGVKHSRAQSDVSRSWTSKEKTAPSSRKNSPMVATRSRVWTLPRPTEYSCLSSEESQVATVRDGRWCVAANNIGCVAGEDDDGEKEYRWHKTKHCEYMVMTAWWTVFNTDELSSYYRWLNDCPIVHPTRLVAGI